MMAGNFTFPKCRLERIAVVSADTTEVLVEYQFSKISGGSVLKRTLAGLPQPVQTSPTVSEPPVMHVTIQSESPAQPVVDVVGKESESNSPDDDIIEVTTTIDDLKKMTKKQLLTWAAELGYDLVDNHVKAQLLEECIEILEGLD